MRHATVLLATAAIFAGSLAQATVPERMHYQGCLTNAGYSRPGVMQVEEQSRPRDIQAAEMKETRGREPLYVKTRRASLTRE